jgi:hypothetical protein
MEEVAIYASLDDQFVDTDEAEILQGNMVKPDFRPESN